MRAHDQQVDSSGRGQLATDLLVHLGFKRIVSCCFRNKRMRLITRTYGSCFKVWCTQSLKYFEESGKVASRVEP